MQLPQLRFAHLRRRIGERIRGRLGLREGDHLADAVGAGHEHGQPIEPKGNAPCGGAPNLSASSRKPNFFCASSEAIPSSSNTVDCISWRWMRTEPPPISEPFNTRS